MTAPLVVIVTGSRHAASYSTFERELNALRGDRRNDGSFGLIIGDNPQGWDRFATEYVIQTGTPFIKRYADWHGRGLAAGPERNALMVEEGRIRAGLGCEVVGFAGWDGRRSKCGTLDAMEQMVKAGFNVKVVAV